MDTIAIAGVGLIGGSFSLALRAAGFDGRILGVSRDPAHALALGVIDEAVPFEEGAGRADVILLARPISRILEDIRRVDQYARPGTLVTDVGSTKRAILDQARLSLRRAVFLGGHPMAGKETTSVLASEPTLFRGRTWFLTPVRAEDAGAAPVLEFREWLWKIGARPVEIGAEEHDRLVALTSHRPQVLSTALAGTVGDAVGVEAARTGSGSGLTDMTRLAASPWDIWADIIATNRDEVTRALDVYLARLREVAAALAGGDDAAVRDAFSHGENFAKPLRRIQ